MPSEYFFLMLRQYLEEYLLIHLTFMLSSLIQHQEVMCDTENSGLGGGACIFPEMDHHC